MSRKRIEQPTPYNSWEEADEGPRNIADAQRAIEKAEHTMQEAIDGAKEAAATETAPFRALIAEEEARLSAYAEAHRDEMGKRKSMDLNYGTVGYRKSTKVMLPRGAAKVVEIIKKLKSLNMGDCVIQPAEKIDKETLKKYPPNDIVAAGAGLDVKDVFWYETKREEIQPNA